MQKTYFFSIVALFLTLTFTSCLKDHTCVCTTTINIPTYGSVETIDATPLPTKTTTKRAKKQCEDVESALKIEIGSEGTATCNLSE